MRILTQFFVTLLLFGILLAAIATSALATHYQVEAASKQAALSRSIAQGASELSYLASDYVIYRESQQLERWYDRFRSYSADVDALRASDPEEQMLVRNLAANTDRLEAAFGNVVSLVGTNTLGQAQPVDPELLQVAWSRIAVQTQGLMADASRLSQQLSTRVDRLQRTNSIIVVAFIGVFGAYFVVNYSLVQRRLLRAIHALQAGTAVIGAGDLDFRIAERRQDEIGDLSYAFNRMTAQLQATTVQVQAERRRYQELFDFAPDGYVVTDGTGIIQAANRAMGDLLGRQPGDLAGQELSRFVAAADAHVFADLLARLTAAPPDEPVRGEVRLQALRGDLIDVAVAATPFSTGAQVTGLRWLVRDVTREKQMHAALVHSEKLSMAGRLAASFAHEINNPLGAALGCTELAMEAYEEGQDPTQYLGVIGTALERTARVVSRMRSLQRPAEMDEKELVDLNTLVENVLLLAQNRATTADVGVSWEPGKDLPQLHLQVDGMQQVFLNLILNAIEAMDSSGGQLSVRVRRRSRPQLIGVEFADDGPGIASGVFEILFEPFNTTKADGSGLGLFVSQDIVQQHGGSIEVVTEAGKGTAFTVWLPVEEPVQPASREVAPPDGTVVNG